MSNDKEVIEKLERKLLETRYELREEKDRSQRNRDVAAVYKNALHKIADHATRQFPSEERLALIADEALRVRL